MPNSNQTIESAAVDSVEADLAAAPTELSAAVNGAPAGGSAPTDGSAPADGTTPAAKPSVRPARTAKTPTKSARKTGPPASDWSPAELKDVRTALAGELGEMQAEYEKSLQELNDLQSSSTDGAGDDQADAGSKTFDREQELSIAANRLDLISQISHAIERVDKGTYGLCEVCGKPIPRVRLEAFPMATLDVACKQREERR